MSLMQIIYVSQPFGFDEATLNSILMDARRNNLRDDVTGALICRADAYLQLIEGPEVAIRATYARIASDNRHLDVNFLFGEPVIRPPLPRMGHARRPRPLVDVDAGASRGRRHRQGDPTGTPGRLREIEGRSAVISFGVVATVQRVTIAMYKAVRQIAMTSL